MTTKEKLALLKCGVIIDKIKYNDVTNVILLPNFLLKFNWKIWSNMATFDEIFYHTAVNSTVLTYRGKYTGLGLMSSYDKNDKRIDTLSFSLNHPMSDYWASIFQPIWEEQNKDKCKTCRGSGWDGETYTLTCAACGGTGKL